MSAKRSGQRFDRGRSVSRRGADQRGADWHRRLAGVMCVVFVDLAGTPAFGQIGGLPLYSIDFQGPTIGTPDTLSAWPISDGDLLGPGGVFPFPAPPPPFIWYTAGLPSVVLGDLGVPAYVPGASGPGIPAGVEVDAVSHGLDWPLDPAFPPHEFLWSFSVDEYAVGFFVGSAPEVASEGAFGATEASADVYVSFPPGAFPPIAAGPFGVGPGNTMLFDGDGVGAASIIPGVPLNASHGFLKEPNPPFVGLPDLGDNLDALDMDDLNTVFLTPSYPVYFSLDGPFADPYYGAVPPNSASAAINGFVGGDVLVTFGPGGPPAIFAPAVVLGLDIFGPDFDDIDALVLAENGSGVYEQSAVDYDWVGGATDMLLFSVRRGSAVIGALDSRFGIPISESDILTPPPAGSPPGTPPGIWMAGENLGLATARSGFSTLGFDDDLDALDLSRDCLGAGMPDIYALVYGLDADCNGNLFPDTCDIANGTSKDCNSNGTPDECEPNSAFADLDSDGDVDGVDFLTFSSCFNGSLNPPRPACVNPCADIDHDGDVDGIDFLTFSICYNGALKPPACP